MDNPFGRYSLPSMFGHQPQASGGNGFGRYSLPNVLGRLFHHGQPSGGYDSSGINPGWGYGSDPFGGQSGFTNGYSVGSGGPFDIGNGFLGGQQYDPFTAGNTGQHTNPFAGGNPAPTGGGPSQTTDGFSSAFRGGGEVYNPADYLAALKFKGGNKVS